MATFSIDKRYNLYQRATLKNQSTSLNTSIVEIETWITSGGSSKFNLNAVNPVKVSANGVTLVDKKISYDFRNKNTITIVKTTISVKHNDDGEKSFNLSSSATLNNPAGNIGSASISQSIKLPRINRKTTPKIPGSFNINNPLPVTLPRASSSFTHRVVMRIRTPEDGIVHLKTASTNATTSVNITLTQAEKNRIYDIFTNTVNASLDVVVTTYDGSGNSLGYTVDPVIGRIPDDIKPSFDELIMTFYDDENKRKEIYDNAVEVSFDITPPSPGRGARIIRTVLNAEDFSDNTLGARGLFTKHGNKRVTVTVTDSRNRSFSRTLNLTVHELGPIVSNNVQLVRCNRNGTVNPNGEYSKVIGDFTSTWEQVLLTVIYTDNESGERKNIWDNYLPATSGKLSNDVKGVQVMDPRTNDMPYDGANLLLDTKSNKSYTVEVYVSYHARAVSKPSSTYRLETILPTIEVIADIGHNGLGFGKVHERGQGDFMGQVYQNDGKLVLDEENYKDYITDSPLSSDYIAMSPGFTLEDGMADKQGNVVSIRGIVRGTIPNGAYTKVGLLPVEFRPPVRIIVGTTMTAGRPGAVELWPNGDIKIGNYSGYNNDWGSLSATFILQ